MSGQLKWDYFKAIHTRYKKTDKAGKKTILDGCCRICGYHRKYAIRLRPARWVTFSMFR